MLNRTLILAALLAGVFALPALAEDEVEHEGTEQEHGVEAETETEHGVETEVEHGVETTGGGATSGSAARGDGASRSGSSARPAHDLQVQMKVRKRKSSEPRVSLKVRNRGSSFEQGATVEVVASDGTPVWTETVDLAPGKKERFRFSVSLPTGATTLNAHAECADGDDDNPSNNDDIVVVTPGGGSDAAIGSAIYAGNCASCHGTDARGSVSGPSVFREDAEEVYEAVREGEGGMPTFPAIGWTEARQIAAFLRDPAGAPAPNPNPNPTPDPNPNPNPNPTPGTAPTYTGQVKALLDTRCGSCHTGARASAGIRLDTYAKASLNAARALASVQAGRMPTSGPLPASETLLLQDWITGGKKQ